MRSKHPTSISRTRPEGCGQIENHHSTLKYPSPSPARALTVVVTRFRDLVLLLSLFMMTACNSNPGEPPLRYVDVVFQEDSLSFAKEQMTYIDEVISSSEKAIRKLLPELPDSIQVIVQAVDWDLDIVGGVTGRTETNHPPLVLVQISHDYKGGIIDSAATLVNGDKCVLYVWYDNEYGYTAQLLGLAKEMVGLTYKRYPNFSETS